MLNKLLNNYKIILGSSSPRRRELLENLDIEFTVIPIKTDEKYPQNLAPTKVPEFLSQKKARAYDGLLQPDWILITADTVVIVDNQIIGKPHTKDKAIEMLKKLSAKAHLVITGVTLRAINRSKSFSCTTKVWFKELEPEEIEYYVEKYKPFDKAGAYGIQEWIGYIGIQHIEGSYYNVVGLPVQKIYTELKSFVKTLKQK